MPGHFAFHKYFVTLSPELSRRLDFRRFFESNKEQIFAIVTSFCVEGGFFFSTAARFLLFLSISTKGKELIKFNCSPLEGVGGAFLRLLIFLFGVSSLGVNEVSSAGEEALFFGGLIFGLGWKMMLLDMAPSQTVKEQKLLCLTNLSTLNLFKQILKKKFAVDTEVK